MDRYYIDSGPLRESISAWRRIRIKAQWFDCGFYARCSHNDSQQRVYIHNKRRRSRKVNVKGSE
jgi:hypothetical protein